MRSPSIEWLHAKIDKNIRLAESYTEIPELGFIIRSCRLKPYEYLFEKREDKIVLYRHWFDEFGNSLKLVKNKKIQIIYNDLGLDRSRITNTDLYYGLTPDRTAKMSKLVHILTGKDDDLYRDCFSLTFLGIDNHLRSYLCLQDEQYPVSPLLLGLKTLRFIAKHSDIKYYLSANKENCTLPCVSAKAWLSYLPVSSSFLSEISKENDTITEVLK